MFNFAAEAHNLDLLALVAEADALVARADRERMARIDELCAEQCFKILGCYPSHKAIAQHARRVCYSKTNQVEYYWDNICILIDRTYASDREPGEGQFLIPQL